MVTNPGGRPADPDAGEEHPLNPPPPLDAASLRQARLGTAVIFLLIGLGTGLWVVHIPVVQKHLALSDGVLGIALFSPVVGALAAMPVAGYASTARGSRFATRVMMAIFCAGLGLPLLAPDLPVLLVAGFVLGFGMGGADVSMNAQAVLIERAMGRPIMSSQHAFYSLGGLIGAVLGGVLLGLPWDGSVNMVAAGLVMFGVAAWAGQFLLREAGHEREATARLGAQDVLRPRLLAIGFLAFASFFSEGAVGDWSSIFLTRHTGASPAMAALGFAGFSVTMTLARFAGDRVVARLGPRRSLVGGGLLAAAGMALALALPSLWTGVLGFALIGLGFANIVPVLFSAAGRVGATPGAGIAVVTMIAYGGLLVGPPLIGGLSEWVGLSGALLVVALLGLIVAAGARVVPER
ncbi:MAG: MFS transporter [Alsobacter sp.]